jgi:hypothetical protein
VLALLNDEVLSDKIKEDAYKDLENISWDNASQTVIAGYKKFNLIQDKVTS